MVAAYRFDFSHLFEFLHFFVVGVSLFQPQKAHQLRDIALSFTRPAGVAVGAGALALSPSESEISQLDLAET